MTVVLTVLLPIAMTISAACFIWSISLYFENKSIFSLLATGINLVAFTLMAIKWAQL